MYTYTCIYIYNYDITHILKDSKNYNEMAFITIASLFPVCKSSVISSSFTPFVLFLTYSKPSTKLV